MKGYWKLVVSTQYPHTHTYSTKKSFTTEKEFYSQLLTMWKFQFVTEQNEVIRNVLYKIMPTKQCHLDQRLSPTGERVMTTLADDRRSVKYMSRDVGR